MNTPITDIDKQAHDWKIDDIIFSKTHNNNTYKYITKTYVILDK